MRLFLLPISTRRSLLYCEKLPASPTTKRTLLDRLTHKANETWVAWESDSKAPLNWKKKVTFYGNQALKRIPYEEWGLKTVPALTAKRRKAIEDGTDKWNIVFPGLYLHQDKIPNVLKQLATDGQAMHRRKMIWSIIAMPFSAPFMLIPVIPNLPFFYLVYRAWSHWKALNGSKTLAFLLSHNLPTPTPSAALDEVYTAGLIHATRDASRAAPRPTRTQAEEIARMVQHQTNGGKEDAMVLQRWNGKLIAEQLGLPDLELEVERAVEQVRGSLEKEKEARLKEEKRELEQAAVATATATATTGEPKETVIHEKAEKVAQAEGAGKKDV